MFRFKVIQRELQLLVKAIPIPYSIDIGRFTMEILYELLPKVRTRLE